MCSGPAIAGAATPMARRSNPASNATERTPVDQFGDVNERIY
jgi:hypothetical protein